MTALGRPAAAAVTLAADARADRRARYLQLIADSLGTHLADNVDYLFEPWGRELPDPGTVGERIAEQLGLLERADVLWGSLADVESRALALRFFAYRALGPAHVRLQLDPMTYRRTVIGLTAQALRQANVAAMPGMPMEWQLHHYDFSALGLPIQAIGSPLPLASTLAFSQYAYRGDAPDARPRPGDVALDVGGCWGDTALWLAHMVGDLGFVHTFEPTPGNRRLLQQNLSLNPHLAPRVTVWEEPVGARSGETVWLQDVLGAGAATHAVPDASRPMVGLTTESIDNIVAAYRIPEINFIKIDVEGADLGVLQGAAETIRSQRPRLAIACYHKPDDLITIPDFVASLGCEYRWYLQCSTMTDIDTVAFGVPL